MQRYALPSLRRSPAGRWPPLLIWVLLGVSGLCLEFVGLALDLFYVIAVGNVLIVVALLGWALGNFWLER